MELLELYWEGDDLIIVTKEGTFRLENAYPTSVEFEGLDFKSNESITFGSAGHW